MVFVIAKHKFMMCYLCYKLQKVHFLGREVLHEIFRKFERLTETAQTKWARFLPVAPKNEKMKKET